MHIKAFMKHLNDLLEMNGRNKTVDNSKTYSVEPMVPEEGLNPWTLKAVIDDEAGGERTILIHLSEEQDKQPSPTLGWVTPRSSTVRALCLSPPG